MNNGTSKADFTKSYLLNIPADIWIMLQKERKRSKKPISKIIISKIIQAT